jgi:hypothetical protein
MERVAANGPWPLLLHRVGPTVYDVAAPFELADVVGTARIDRRNGRCQSAENLEVFRGHVVVSGHKDPLSEALPPSEPPEQLRILRAPETEIGDAAGVTLALL